MTYAGRDVVAETEDFIKKHKSGQIELTPEADKIKFSGGHSLKYDLFDAIDDYEHQYMTLHDFQQKDPAFIAMMKEGAANRCVIWIDRAYYDHVVVDNEKLKEAKAEHDSLEYAMNENRVLKDKLSELERRLQQCADEKIALETENQSLRNRPFGSSLGSATGSVDKGDEE